MARFRPKETLVASTYGRAARIINVIRAHAKNACASVAVASALAVSPVSASDQAVIVAFGDSLTAGYGLQDADSFPVRLEAKLAEDGILAQVVNSGVSGDTSAGGRARLAWSLPETRPDLVILELGANDGLRGIDPAEMETNLDAMLAELGRRDIPVLLAGMLAPPNLGRLYAERYNAVFPRLAKKYDVTFYPFFLDGVAADPALNQPDGLHPNASGVVRIVERIAPYVAKALDASAPQSPSGG